MNDWRKESRDEVKIGGKWINKGIYG